MSFVSLHNHTELSLLDGLSKRKDIIKKAVEFGMPAVAVTEHGNMFQSVSFVKACRKAGIKPIQGTEFYLAPDTRFGRQYASAHKLRAGEVDAGDILSYAYHLTVLAKNEVGYQNLVRLNTIAWREGFYRKPRIDMEVLTKYSEGLIVLSGCLGSITSQLIVTGRKEEALQQVDRFRAIFGEDFYLELMAHDIPDERVVAEALIEFSKLRGIGTVLTGDAHFTECGHSLSHEVALAVGTRRQMSDENRFKFEGTGYWFKSPQEMWESCLRAGYPEEAYTNSIHIASTVQDYKLRLVGEHGTVHQVPTYVSSDGTKWSAEDCHIKLRMEAYAGLARLIEERPEIEQDPRYVERLEFELDMMQRKNFSSYFLVIAGIIKFMWDELGILKPAGRGSSLGSLVCYCLGITALDPVKWNVPFSRFINEGRKDLPDVDTDISQRHRKEVLGFIADTYGRDNVAMIATFMAMGAKAVIDKVGSALGIPPPIRQQVSKAMGDLDPDETFADVIDSNPKVRELMEGVEGWIDHCLVLDGNFATTSKHAAGVVISNTPFDGQVPLMRDADGFRLTQYDMKDLADLGLLKLDMLGLKTMDLIQDSFDNIVKLRPGLQHNKPGVITTLEGDTYLDFYHMPIEDEATYKMLARGEWVSVFQYDSHGMRKMAQDLRPETLEHLMALNALFRPGPLKRQPILDENGKQVGEHPSIADQYIARRHGREPTDVWHPDLKQLMEPTYGLPLFQEQVSGLAQIMAGFDDTEADEYRKAVGKKDAELFAKTQAHLIERGVAIGRPRELLEDIAAKLEGFARYGWNRGHSLSYSYLSFVTAFLECNYPFEYYTALLNQPRSSEDQAKILAAISGKGVRIVAPDINESGYYFTTDGKQIWMGMVGVDKMKSAAIVPILYDRERNGPFRSFVDFVARTSVPSTIPTEHPLAQQFIIPEWDTEKKGEPGSTLRLMSVNKTVKTNLVKVGAVSWDTMMTDYDKAELVDKLSKAAKKHFHDPLRSLKIVDAVIPDLTHKEFTQQERMKFEHDILGFYISGHPSTPYRRLLEFFHTHPLRPVSPVDLPDQEPGAGVILLGSVVGHQMATTATTGAPYIRVTIGDQFGQTLVMVWSPDAERFWPHIRKGQPLMFAGSIKEDRRRPGATQFGYKSLTMLDNGIPCVGVFGEDPKEVAYCANLVGQPDAHVGEVAGWGSVTRFQSPVYVPPEMYEKLRQFDLGTSGRTRLLLGA